MQWHNHRVAIHSLFRTVSHPQLKFGALVFVEAGKRENQEEYPRSKGENQQQTQPTYDVRPGNKNWATLAGGQHSHHYAILLPNN